MQFDEIPAGAKIVMNVSNRDKMQAKFISRVIKNLGSGILVFPLMHKGRRVNFKGDNVFLHMDVQLKTGESYTFKSCQVVSVRKDGLIFHKISSSMTKGIENRRGEYRCYIGEPAMFNIEGLPDPVSATLKDISASGFGFMLERKIGVELMPGVMVTCSFTDNKGNPLKSHGKIVRKEKMNDFVMYGCRSSEQDPEIAEYVKQLEEKTMIINDSLVQIG